MRNIPFDIIYELYIIQNKTFGQISTTLNISVGSAYNYVKKYNIPIRSKREVQTKKHGSIILTNIKCKFCGNYIPERKPSKQGLFCDKRCYGKWKSIYFVGKTAPNYKHGKCGLLLRIRANGIYRQWVLSVFKRDGFTCQSCGDDSGGNLEAHHKKSFAVLCHENRINSLSEAKKSKYLWDINNGITLCKKCHKKTKNYGYNKYTTKIKI